MNRIDSRTPDYFPLTITAILMSGIGSALLDATIGWENLATQIFTRLSA